MQFISMFTGCRRNRRDPSGPLWSLVGCILLLALTTLACSAAAKPDPWQEYRRIELKRVEEFGEPKSFYAVYKGSFGPATIRMATWFLGDEMFRADSDMGIISVSMGSDGKNGWIQTKGSKPRVLSSTEQDELFSSKYFDSTEYLSDEALTYEIGKPEKWDGKNVQVVELTSSEGYRRDLFITDGTWELIGYRSYGTSTTLIKLYETEWMGAMAVPHRIAMTLEDLNFKIEMTLVEAEVDIEIDPTLFIAPEGEFTPLIAAENVRKLELDLHSSAPGTIVISGGADGKVGEFLLDTGASSSLLDPEIVSELSIAEESSFAAVGIAGAEETRIVRLKSGISLGEAGELRFPGDVGYIVMSLGAISKATGVSLFGIIGQDLMERAIVRIDFISSRLTITPYEDEQFPESGGDPLAALFGTNAEPSLAKDEYGIVRIGDLIAVNCGIGDAGNALMIVDTGFSGSIGLLPAAVEKFNLPVENSQKFDIVRGVGGVTKLKGRVPKLHVTAFGVEREFENVPVISGPIASVVGGAADGLIGSLFFEGMSIEFDYAAGKIRVIRRTKK